MHESNENDSTHEQRSKCPICVWIFDGGPAECLAAWLGLMLSNGTFDSREIVLT